MLSRNPSWYLTNLCLFDNLPGELLKPLLERAVLGDYPARRSVPYAESSDRVQVLTEGAAKLCRKGMFGRKIIECIMEPGDVFGRISIESRRGTRYVVETLEPTRIFSLERGPFTDLIHACPQFAYRVFQLVEERERILERRVENLIFKDVRTRVVETLLHLARHHAEKCQHGWAVDVRVTQQDIADLVGATRQIVSKILRELELKLYIRRKGRVICILSIKRLAHLAEAER